MSQTERIHYIDRIIREKGSVTSEHVAQRFENSVRQVKRDIEYMRDRLGAPILYDRNVKGYCYKTDFPQLHYSDEKTLIFRALIRSFSHTAQMAPFVSEPVLDVVEKAMSERYRILSDRILYSTPVIERCNLEVFKIICESMSKERCVEISYTNASGKSSRRTIEALKLINYSGRWYIVAHDLSKNSLRSFHLGRISDISMSETPMKKLHNEEYVEEYVSCGFGIFMGTETHEAVIRISGNAVHSVRNQIWHENQNMEEFFDSQGTPYLMLHVPVTNWSELLGRILSFGACAEPIAPEELRTRWKYSIQELATLSLHS